MIFISHKNDPDHESARAIAQMLRSNGISCWLAPESIAEGKDHAMEIVNAINSCEIFLLILTEQTHLSEYVRLELTFARDHKKKIIPLKIGTFEPDDVFKYLLGDKQAKPFNLSSQEDCDWLADECRTGEQVVNMELNKNPRMSFSLIKGSFSDNIKYFIDQMPDELQRTIFASGIDCSSDLLQSCTTGILKVICDFLNNQYSIGIDQLQRLIDEAKVSQLKHKDGKQEMKLKDSIVVEVPICNNQIGEKLILTLLLIANSRKRDKRGDINDVIGVDSREIILEIFNKCAEIGEKSGDRATNLMLGAIGTNAMDFPYGVITAEILNCFAFVKAKNDSLASQKIRYPLNLWYSVRVEDMQRVGLSADEVMSYISSVIRFVKEN